MKRSIRQSQAESNSLYGRRGILTAWTIWIMLAVGVIIGGLFNVIWLSGIRNQARNCAASAAVAAGHSYLSDDMLRARQQSFEYEGREARCRQAAVSMVDKYRRGTSLPPITEDHVLVQWPENQWPVRDPALLVPSFITVAFDGKDKPYHVPFFFSGLTGVQSSQLGVRCSVALEHAPTAFRPTPNASVPLLPFAVCDDVPENKGGTGAVTNGVWTTNIESGMGTDRYSWNNEKHEFESGSDGLTELTVTIYSSTLAGAPDAFIPMSFSANPGVVGSAVESWIQNGLTLNDLRTQGREEVSFPGSMPTASLTSLELNACASALQKKCGEPCLIFLCSANPVSGSQPSLTLKRPVAARVIRATSISGSVKVILQPCILVTATAVTSTSPAAAANRYVYSIRLQD